MRVQTRPGQERRQALRLLGWVVGARTVGVRSGYEAPIIAFPGFLAVTVSAVVVGSQALVTGQVIASTPTTTAHFTLSGATSGDGAVTLAPDGTFSFLVDIAYGITAVRIDAVDGSRAAFATDEVERVVPPLVAHVAATLDGTTAHVSGWLEGWFPETTASFTITGGASASGPVTLAPDRSFAFDVTGLGYGVTTITVTATDTWRSDDGADSVNRVAPALSITAYAELLTTTGIKAHLYGTVTNAIGGITRLWYSYRDPDGSSFDYDITTATPFDVENGPWADGHNEYTFHVTDGLGRTAHASMVHIDVTPLLVTIDSVTWYGFHRSLRVIGSVSGYYHAPTVTYEADTANPGTGSVSIDGSGDFDFYVAAPLAGGTGITVRASETT